MIKRFPSRNQRSKGIKVKHVLQIALLLGVCFWLIYQVKHNHDKKKEFDKDAKLSLSTQTDPILKLGRRDLHPGKHEETLNEKHEEEDEDEHIEEHEENKHGHEELEDENKHEENKQEVREQGEEVNKHGAEEQEEDENKNEDVEEEGGGGDDEIDENDQEKPEVDTTDRDDEFLDEEKEKEEADEKENENEDEEKETLVENHDNHEAREEHYKGDDASSAVAHDTHAISTETETLSLENSDVNLEMNIIKPENETTYSDESLGKQNDSDLKVSGDMIDGISSNATAVQEAGNNTLSNPVDDSSFLNKTTATDSDNHLESSSNLSVVTAEASNNLTGAGNDTSSSSEQNKTVMLSESDQAQNSTMNTTIPGDVKNVQTGGLEQSANRTSDENLHDTNSMVSVKTENRGVDAGESSNLVASNVTENTYRDERSEFEISDETNDNTETKENQNVDATQDEMLKGDTQTGESDETNETLDSAEEDAIDSFDTRVHEDVTEARTDLDTLPDIKSEGDGSDETAAD